MRNVMIGVAFLYFLLVANFYNNTDGFVKFYNEYYALWKVTPLVLLVLFSLLHGGGMGKNESTAVAVGLAFGGLGDYLIGASHDGIVTGAIAFGIGHLIYLSLFFNKKVPLHWPSVAAVLGWSAITGHVCLTPLLATQPIPVLIMSLYSLTLCTNLIVSLSQYINRRSNDHTEPLLFRMLGFFLFFTSDTLLIYHHTGFNLYNAEVLILSTYYSAQFLILHSFVSRANASSIRVKQN